MPTANLLILIAVLLPPKALEVLGSVVEERTLLTPYGEAGPFGLHVNSAGQAVWVEPYSGLPTRTDSRATIYAAKQLGVSRILNWDTGIALNPVLERGEAAVVTDYIAWIHHQADTFYTTAPIEMDLNASSVRTAFCPELTTALQQLLPSASAVAVVGVDFLRRETAAEARMFRAWGADVLSYNLVPEVGLAQEMGLCYAGLLTIGALAADRTPPDPRGEVRASFHPIVEMLPTLVGLVGGARGCGCGH